MDALEFRVFLNLLMALDPWPLEFGEDEMKFFADRHAIECGYDGWIDAFHRHP